MARSRGDVQGERIGMKKEVKEKWVAALRSGNYAQGTMPRVITHYVGSMLIKVRSTAAWVFLWRRLRERVLGNWLNLCEGSTSGEARQ